MSACQVVARPSGFDRSILWIDSKNLWHRCKVAFINEYMTYPDMYLKPNRHVRNRNNPTIKRESEKYVIRSVRFRFGTSEYKWFQIDMLLWQKIWNGKWDSLYLSNETFETTTLFESLKKIIMVPTLKTEAFREKDFWKFPEPFKYSEIRFDIRPFWANTWNMNLKV